MEFLILSAILASAAAAPSGAIVGPIASVPIASVPIGPVPIPTIPIPAIKTLPSPAIQAIPIVGVKTLAAIPVAAPTISPGDIQAAAINAKVEVEDYLRAAAEKNREINEQALKDQADKIVEASNIHSEKNQEAFWEVEDKKWQALNALQTAQAKIDGLVASNADLLGKTVLRPNPIPPIVPGLTPISPYVFSAVAIKGENQENKEEIKTEELKTQEIKTEEVKEDSVQIESADSNEQAAVRTPAGGEQNEQKTTTNEQNMATDKKMSTEPKVKESAILAPVVANLGFPLYAPIAGVPVNLNEVGWQATLLQPGVKILTPGLSVAQGGIVASIAGKSSW